MTLVKAKRGPDIYWKVSMGCPQGWVLGPTLWNVLMDDLLRLPLPDGVRIVTHADDDTVLIGAQTILGIENKAREALEVIKEWGGRNRLEFSPSKSQAMTMRGSKIWCAESPIPGYLRRCRHVRGRLLSGQSRSVSTAALPVLAGVLPADLEVTCAGKLDLVRLEATKAEEETAGLDYRCSVVLSRFDPYDRRAMGGSGLFPTTVLTWLQPDNPPGFTIETPKRITASPRARRASRSPGATGREVDRDCDECTARHSESTTCSFSFSKRRNVDRATV
ncbi:Retrovirus-related Pol polyprotein from type-1 retrotransposable element R1 [Eumeta japonica]|uniref:Retrovirus-related Pol polyprotein from type-1 retrotransposable element R1 n=1 Tax=Eumeta variegata TaxID=151549 RepID=A0A4C1ZU57_EUMVA|nr:Retrovirus-related Pol polyprotein from type-1 retrotransposable element R1 [Eumeta japonica]